MCIKRQCASINVNKYCGELETAGKTIFRFGFGQSPFPVPDSIVSSLEENAYRKDYLPVEGLYDLRQAVAEFHQKTDKIKSACWFIYINSESVLSARWLGVEVQNMQ